MPAGQKCSECGADDHNVQRCPLLADGRRPRSKLRLVVLHLAAERRNRGVSVEQWRAAPSPPLTRDGCRDAPRPCLALRCRYHIGLLGPADAYTCALDAAELGGMTLEEISVLMGVTRERVRQIEKAALPKLRNHV